MSAESAASATPAQGLQLPEGLSSIVDTNKDGIVSEEEAAAFISQLKEKNPAAFAEIENFNKKYYETIQTAKPAEGEVSTRAAGTASSSPFGMPSSLSSMPGVSSPSNSSLGFLGPLLASMATPSSGGAQQQGSSASSSSSGLTNSLFASLLGGGSSSGGGSSGGPNFGAPQFYQPTGNEGLQFGVPAGGPQVVQGPAQTPQQQTPVQQQPMMQQPMAQSTMGGGAPFDPKGHAMAFKTIPSVFNCDRCGQGRPQGMVHARCDICNYDICAVCVPVPPGMGGQQQQPPFQAQQPMPASGGGPPMDPKGHQMTLAAIQTIYNCDGCGKQRPQNELHYRCNMCNVDYCPQCRAVPAGGPGPQMMPGQQQPQGNPPPGVFANPNPPPGFQGFPPQQQAPQGFNQPPQQQNWNQPPPQQQQNWNQPPQQGYNYNNQQSTSGSGLTGLLSGLMGSSTSNKPPQQQQQQQSNPLSGLLGSMMGGSTSSQSSQQNSGLNGMLGSLLSGGSLSSLLGGSSGQQGQQMMGGYPQQGYGQPQKW